MRRRAATGLGALLAVSSVAGAVAISGELAGARRGERRAYASALTERETAALATSPAESGDASPGFRSRTLCLRGAETVVARVARFLDSRPIDAAGRLDLVALARLSRRAAELDRSAALPQRMGRRRAPGTTAPAGSPSTGDSVPAWEPIVPPERICVELAETTQRAAHGSRRAAGAK